MQLKKFAKGGKIIVQEKDYLKFSKLGIVNKYEIEAINDIGLANVKFDKESVLKLVEDKFQELLDKYEENLINEDSEIITKQIQYEIETLKTEGASLQSIEEKEKNITDNEYRKKLIDEYRQTQKDTAKTWVDYLKQSDYNTSFKYLILKAVLNFNYDLKQDKLFSRNEKTIRNITPFDASALAELYTKNSDFLLRDYINIQSENSLKVINSKGTIATNKNGRWIKFDGGEKTSDAQININAQELSRLVQNTFWCTKSNASGQLKGGDFYVYVTTENNNVQPRIAVRMNEDEVGEVRGNRSDKQDLEDEMLPIAEDFLIKNIPNNSGVKWLDSIKYNEKALYLRKKIKEAEFLTEDIFSEANKIIAQKDKYNVDYGENGNVTILISELKNKIDTLPSYDNKKNKLYYEEVISAYKILNEIEPSAYNDNVIESYQILIDLDDSNNENIVFKEQVTTNISEITSKTKYLLIFNTSYINNDWSNEMYSSLEYIYVKKAKFLSIPKKLKFISGDADFENSKITDLGNLTTIGGDAYFGNSKITDLGNLTTIGGSAYFDDYSQITDLGNLTTIGGNAFFENSKITDLGNLTTIGGDVYFGNSKITDLGNLTTIGSNVYFENSKITDLGNLTTIGGDAFFENSKITDLGNLTTIGGDANFNISQITKLGNLTTIGGDADFENSKITDLGNLTTIGGIANFPNSKITDLGNLTTIGGDAYFGNSKITDLGNLTTIGGYVFFHNSQITDLGKLKEVGEIKSYNTILYEKPNNIKTIKLVNFEDLPLLKTIKKIEKIEIKEIRQEKIDEIFNYGGKEILQKIEIEKINLYNSEASAILNIFTEINSHVEIKDCYALDLTNVKKIKSLSIIRTDILNFSVEEITESFYYNIGNFSVGDLKKIGSLEIRNTLNNYSLNNITEIRGEAIISEKALDLGKIEKIEGDFESKNSIKNNQYLKYVGGNLYWKGNDLGVLEYVGETLHLETGLVNLNNLKFCKSIQPNGASIESFGNLTSVTIEDRFIGLYYLKTFGNVKRITSTFEDFSISIEENIHLESLGNLEFIGGQLVFGSKLRDTGNLKKVKSLVVQNNENINFKSIEIIEKHFNLQRCKLNNFGSINYVGEINIESCEIDSFDNLKECDSLNVKNSLINSLSTLTTINNSCNILKSIVKSTGKLSRIGGDLILQETEVVDFNVEIIEGNASFRNSNVVSANKLETIKGDAWFGNSNLINMDSIKRILGSISYGDNTALKIKIEPILKQEMIKRGIFRNGGNILLKKK
jgi:hypothetical protein